MLRCAQHLSAHRERPEARAQGDKTLPILVVKVHYRPVSVRVFCQYALSANQVEAHESFIHVGEVSILQG
jgi:hypothetical protein